MYLFTFEKKVCPQTNLTCISSQQIRVSRLRKGVFFLAVFSLFPSLGSAHIETSGNQYVFFGMAGNSWALTKADEGSNQVGTSPEITKLSMMCFTRLVSSGAMLMAVFSSIILW